MFGLPAGVDPDLHVVESLHLTVVALDHELDLLVARAERVRHEVQRRLFYLNTSAPGVPQREQLLVHRDGHVPDYFAIVLVLLRMNVEKETHHLRAASAEAHGLAGLALRDAPDLRVIERTVLDLAGDAGPAPRGVDLVQERPRRVP